MARWLKNGLGQVAHQTIGSCCELLSDSAGGGDLVSFLVQILQVLRNEGVAHVFVEIAQKSRIVAFESGVMEIVVYRAMIKRNELHRVIREVITTVAVGRFKLAKNDPDPEHVKMCADQQWPYQCQCACRQKFEPMKVIAIQRAGILDAMMYNMYMSQQPGVVHGPVHPVIQEIVQYNEESQLCYDPIPGRYLSFMDGVDLFE